MGRRVNRRDTLGSCEIATEDTSMTLSCGPKQGQDTARHLAEKGSRMRGGLIREAGLLFYGERNYIWFHGKPSNMGRRCVLSDHFYRLLGATKSVEHKRLTTRTLTVSVGIKSRRDMIPDWVSSAYYRYGY